MYSPRVIEACLYEFKGIKGWMPEYHSVDETNKFRAHIDGLVNVEENRRGSTFELKRDLTNRELRWIANERALCSFDAQYFKTRYAWICDEENAIFKYSPRVSQLAFHSILEDFDDKQVAMEILCLKGRQQGISTEVALDFLHRMLFIPATQAIMASVRADKSALMYRIITTATQRLPWWLIPEVKQFKTGKMLEYEHGSIVSIQTGAQQTGIAQGWTPTLVHISECGDYPNPKQTLEVGLMRATHPSRALFAVYEGTGNGNTGWQADKWRWAKENWPKGRSRLMPLFIPWHMARDLYPHPDWLRKNPLRDDWKPNGETRKHVVKCENYVRNTPVLSKILGAEWAMPREQQWYWFFNHEEAKGSNTEKLWLQQMPADDLEALTGKNDMVFDQERIEVLTREREKYQVYGIVGEGIDEEFEPHTQEVDYEKPRIEIKWKSPRGQDYEWVLIPMLPIDDSDEKSCLGKLIVFEPPGADVDYSAGVDCSDGLGEDRAVISVARNEKDEGCDFQMCEYNHDRMNAPQLVGPCACIAAWYGERTLDPRGMKFAIEQRRKPGDDCQHQLKRMGFNFHHIMIYYDNKDVKENVGRKEGWYTNAWSRSMLLGRYVDAVKNAWYTPNSPFLIHEFQNFERRLSASGLSRMEHQAGKHDDRIFASAMSYFTRHAMDVMLERGKKRYNLPKGKLPELDLSPYTGFQIGIGTVPWSSRAGNQVHTLQHPYRRE
jgi:hypothetical protein